MFFSTLLDGSDSMHISPLFLLRKFLQHRDCIFQYTFFPFATIEAWLLFFFKVFPLYICLYIKLSTIFEDNILLCIVLPHDIFDFVALA